MKAKLLIALVFFGLTLGAFAQVPNISYASPQTYTVNTAITPLTPTNSGGAVAGVQVSTLAGSGFPGAANGTGTAASFYGPGGMATDALGNVYVADNGDNLIRKISPAGVVTTLAGSGAPGSANGTGAAASFNGPAGVALDAAGNVYVADQQNQLIRKISPAGVVTTLAGSGAQGSANGTGTAASFYNPVTVSLDASGNVFVGDFGNNLIREISPAGVVTTFAGNGSPGSANGTGTAASFNGPGGIVVNASGYLYVADANNNLVRQISPAGVVTTLAGSGSPGSANGTGTAASFNGLAGVAQDASGNVYVTDANNNLIREISPAGVVTTLAGSGAQGSGNGPGTAASFHGPGGIALDASGNVYIADFYNSLIRKITLGFTISPALPSGLSFDSTSGIISGTPTVNSPATNYTVIATNSSGSNTATVNIAVTSGLDKLGVTAPASAAYSLRQLKTNYAHAPITAPGTVGGFTNSVAPVVRVRRSADNGQLDIGYTANGDLDTATLKSFVGTGNGYVSIWYDQSGNSYDVAQTNSALQPALATNGVVERSGALPAVRFTNAQKTVLFNSVPASAMFGSGYKGSAFPVLEATASNVYASAFGYGNNSDRWQVHAIAGAYFDVGNPSNRVFISNSSYTGTIKNYSFLADNALQQIYVTGVLQSSSSAVLSPCTQTQFNIGGIPNFDYYHQGHESEVVLYGSAVSTSDRQAVETNQEAYYGLLTATITSFSPRTAVTGTAVTIQGTNLNGVTRVLFGGVAASSFTINSSTSITAIVAGGATGSISLVSTTGTVSFAGFNYGSTLDKVDANVSAQAAYSLRQLKSNYTHTTITAPTTVNGFTNSATPVARVRRAADNAQLDIGYTANGDLDTATLKSFVGAGSGYVATWYDQSGNSFDVTQSTASKQPALVTNGVVERSGTMPALRFTNSQKTVLFNSVPASTMFGSGYIGSVFPVLEAAAAGVNASAFGYGANNDRWQVHAITGAYFDVGNPLNRISTQNSSLAGTIANYSFITGINQQQIYVNGTLQASSTAGLTGCTQTQFNIGGIPNFDFWHNGHESEIIVYNTTLSTSDQQTVQTNQSGYYMPPANNAAMAVNMQQPQGTANGVNMAFTSVGGSGTTTYALQKQTDNGSFASVAALTGLGTGSFTSVDTNPTNGINYYKVQATDSKGNQAYSEVVRLSITNGRGTSIAPNPVLNKQVVVHFNKLPQGQYLFTMASISGNVVDKRTLIYDGDSPAITFAAPVNAHTGVYIVTISSADYKRSEKVVIE